MTDICELCTRPTRNAAYACDDCGDTFANDLKALVDWLDDDLETCISGAKGVDWRKGTSRGGGEAGLRINWRATELYRKLQRALCDTVDHCLDVKVRHVGTTDGEPARTVPAMSEWLRWRVDGLALDKAGPRHIGRIGDLVVRSKAVVNWEPPERRFLGPCNICGEGHVYAEGDAIEATCDRCEAAFAADLRRVDMIKTMDDRLATAADIADLSTYLGLHKDREKVRKQVNVWHHRKVIEAKASDKGGDPMFRLGDVWRRLKAQDDALSAS